MSGYATKAEAIEVVRESIRVDSANTGLSRNPRDYNMTAIIAETVQSRGHGYGWSIALPRPFYLSLVRNLKPKARPTNLIAVDADCPGCGYPERRYNLDTGIFSCSGLNPERCRYESRERNG